MLRRKAIRRSGFTLIELLVVISIIAVVMSLLLAGVMKALGVGPKAETTARISAINNAIGTFKSNQSFGQVSYIPPGALYVTTGTWGPFRLRNSYSPPGGPQPDQNSFEAQYLQQVFGGGRPLNWGDLGMGSANWGADLDANQTLTFFLTGLPAQDNQGNTIFTGFSTNQMKPFTPRASPTETRRGPVLQLSGRQFIVDGSGFARVIDAHAYTVPGQTIPGTPFVYFAAYNGQANKLYGGYNPLAPGVVPYNRGGQFENASGFQIISAGKNRQFGTSGTLGNVGEAGSDDQANFSSNVLGSTP
jgi:prepilin-type N-terminal cleavage/methylation domain-containing protein